MNQQLNRRRFLKTVAAGTSAAVLAACGAAGGGATGGGAAASGETGAAPPAEGAGAVRALAWSNSPAIDDHFKKRVELFNQAGQGTVDLQFFPYDQYWQKIDLAYASNQPYDIYYWDIQAYGHYKRDLLLNVDSFLKEGTPLLDEAAYPVKLYDPWKFDGANLYGVPENLQSMVLYYNKDLFDKAGVEYPNENWTWDDAIAAAKQLTIREGEDVQQFGLDIGALSVWWGLQTISWAQDDAFFDKELEPTTFQMNKPANIEAMRFVQDMIWKEQVAPNAAQRTAVGQDVGIFQSGRTALVADGSWSIANFSSLPFKWDIAPLPKWGEKRVVPYWLGGWVITKGSKVPQESYNYANWSATEFQNQMAKDHDWIPLQNEARNGQDMLASMPSGFTSALEAIDNAKIGDLYHRNSQQILNEVLGPIFTQVWENTLTPEDAAAQIDEKANALLAK